MQATSPRSDQAEPMSSADPQDQGCIPDRRLSSDVQAPPSTFGGILRQVGPGLIIAANIVGSGELIMTTKTGAQAGISLLWLILIGCLVKVFVQLEFGRFAISAGETTLTSLNRVPGPRLFGINWIVAFWLIMITTSTAQLGGIAGGVGQSLSLTIPLTGDYSDVTRCPSVREIRLWADSRSAPSAQRDPRQQKMLQRIEDDILALGEKGVRIQQLVASADPQDQSELTSLVEPQTYDDKLWAVLLSVITAVVLCNGRYRLVELFSVTLVVAFTFITIGNVLALQNTDYGLSSEQILQGFSFGLPEGSDAVLTALATFGIIGVGATELISYPYWCIEKGYARFAGPREQSAGWLTRAQGWIRVMKWDAFLSMIVYTFATAAFYIMGVCVLYAEGRDPEGMRMVGTLSRSYVPIFGEYARWLFLCGAVAVLYSTFLVANAANARMIADFLGVAGIASREHESESRRKLVKWLATALPLICGAAYIMIPAPVVLIKIAGLTQALMLPMLAFAAIHFRSSLTDPGLRPGKAWDIALGISSVALLITASWGGWKAAEEFLAWINGG